MDVRGDGLAMQRLELVPRPSRGLPARTEEREVPRGERDAQGRTRRKYRKIPRLVLAWWEPAGGGRRPWAATKPAGEWRRHPPSAWPFASTAQEPPLRVRVTCLCVVATSACFVSRRVDLLMTSSHSSRTVIAAVGEPLTAKNNTGRAEASLQDGNGPGASLRKGPTPPPPRARSSAGTPPRSPRNSIGTEARRRTPARTRR